MADTAGKRLLLEISKGRSNKYSVARRKFALTLRFLSPAAYRYCRQCFDNGLPSCRVIRKWYSNIDAKPGHMKEAFDYLKNMAKNREYHVTISMDEMSIMQHVEFIKSENLHSGYTTIDFSEDGNRKMATKALAFLVAGINEPFKIPVSYFFVDNGLKSDAKAQLLDDVLAMVIEAGLTVRSVTSDGDPSNLKAFECLGASFANYEPFFYHEKQPNIRIYVTLDACHSLKNARNLIGNYKYITNNEGQIVEWSHFCKLEEMQTANNARIMNVKITKKHIQYEHQKMKVSLAAQTLSNSVANAFQLLESQKVDGFEAASVSSEYCLYFDKAFNILNSHACNATGFKSPLNSNNINSVKVFISQFSEYVCGLRTTYKKKIVRIIDSQLKTSYLGFICTLNNVVHLYEDLVQTGIMTDFFTLRISQDLLEYTFGQIRQAGSNNRNPTAMQFEAAMRKILFDNEVKASQHSNVQDFGIPLLTVSSTKKNETNVQSKEEQLQPYPQRWEWLSNQHGQIPSIQYEMIVFRAGCMENKISLGISCQQCKSAAFQGTKVHGGYSLQHFINAFPNWQPPCLETFFILSQTEELSQGGCQFVNRGEFEAAVNGIVHSLPIDGLYGASTMNHCNEHKKNVIKSMITFYLQTRLREQSKVITESSKRSLSTNKAAKVRQFDGR